MKKLFVNRQLGRRVGTNASRSEDCQLSPVSQAMARPEPVREPKFRARSGAFMILALAGAVAWAEGAAWAGPLIRAQLPAEAKWVLHLDLDSFRSSQVGAFLTAEKIAKDMAKAAADLKTYLDFDFDWTRINSVTAYGTDFSPRDQARGVLLVHTSLDVQQGLDTAIAKQAQAGVDGNVQKIEDGSAPVYRVRDEVFVAFPAGGPVVLAKAREMLDQGLGVLAGQAPNLAGTQTFLDFPPAPAGFVFLGMAEGFADQPHVPPQAQVLKMTDAGQVVAGETGTALFVTVTLRAKTMEVSAQIQQVIQGLLALGALGQPENLEWQQLIQATRVTKQDRMVTVAVQLPVTTLVEKLQSKLKP